MEKKNIDWGSIGFGYIPTDYRYVANFKDGKWDEGTLTTDPNVTLNECACKAKSEKQSLKDSGKTGDSHSGCGEQFCRKSAFSAGNAGGRLLSAASGH